MLIIDFRTLEFTRSRLITGVIYFDFENIAFPEKGWNDFVGNLLEWWTKALSNERSPKFYFMDGPFEIKLRPKGSFWQVDMLERRANGTIKIQSTKVEKVLFSQNITEVVYSFLVQCQKNNLKNDQVVYLQG